MDFEEVANLIEHLAKTNTNLKYRTKLRFFDIIKGCQNDQLRSQMFLMVNEDLLGKK